MEAQQAQPGGLLLADLPLAVVFDIWIANCDRWSRNLLLQPERSSTSGLSGVHSEQRNGRSITVTVGPL